MKENQIILTKESGNDDIRKYFEGVLQLSKSNEEYPVNLDDVWPLVYGQKGDAVGALKKRFEEGIDYKVIRQNPKNLEGGRPVNEYYLTTSCLEYFIARKVRPVFEVYRAVFHKVANSQVVALPDFSNPAEAARAWAEQYEMKMLEARRADEAEKQVLSLSREIESMQPKVSYYDTILASKETVTITQIAQDYGLSAKALNKVLEDLRVQHKVNGQWILYAPFISQGYVHSKPVNITRSDGRPDVKLNTEMAKGNGSTKSTGASGASATRTTAPASGGDSLGGIRETLLNRNVRDQLDREDFAKAFQERTGISVFSDDIENLHIHWDDGDFHNEPLRRVPILTKSTINWFLGGFNGGYMSLQVDETPIDHLYFKDYKDIRLTFDYKGVHQNMKLFGNSKLKK